LLRLRHLQFENGVLEVYSQDDVNFVKQCDDFQSGNIQELSINEPNDVQPTQPIEGQARVGMRSSADPSDLPDENAQPERIENELEIPIAPDPAKDLPESAFPEAQWPQDEEKAAPAIPENSVLAKPGGWYEYQGKNYRKADLPEEARRLI
jgi:hypothetical protein